MTKISVVINTRNEEKNLPGCLTAVQKTVDEIVICDMESTDNTKKIAKEFNARIFSHKNVNYVEPARNFAIDKAKGNWILLLDADEIIDQELLQKLINFAESKSYDFVRIPRKNIIFGKWIKYTGWWPDYQIRFFRKSTVTWGDEIHSIPLTKGKGFDLPAEEKNALMHHIYQSTTQFIERLNRYTTAEAQEIVKEEANFEWQNIIRKPSQEFLSRFFMREGYKDGVHGLILSLLQAFSMLTVQVKVWEMHKFPEVSSKNFLDLVAKEERKERKDFVYWFFHKRAENASGLSRFIFKIRSRLHI